MSVDLKYARMYAENEVAQSERSELPTAVIVVTQPGALGSSLVREHLHDQLQRAGGYVMADSEVLRSRLPYVRDLDPTQVNIGRETAADVKIMERETERIAIENRRNLVVDSAGRTSTEMLDLSSDLRKAGYRVELHALAVHDQIVFERAMTAYETARSHGDLAVWVDQHDHDRSVREGSDIVRRLEYAGAVDKITVYNRLNDVVLEHKPEPGRIVAGETFDRARVQMSDYERVSLAEKWDQIVELQESRFDPLTAGISSVREDRMGDIELRYGRAHYTLHSSPAAVESYNERNPAERFTSKEYADAYGEKLAQAFRNGDREKAETMPELAKAFAALAAGVRSAQDGPGVEAALRERIASGLQKGDSLKDSRLSEAALFTEQQQLVIAGRKGGNVSGVMEYEGQAVSHVVFVRHQGTSGAYFNLAMLDGAKTVDTPRGVNERDLATYVGDKNAAAIRRSSHDGGTLMGPQLQYAKGKDLDRAAATSRESVSYGQSGAELSR